MLARRSALGAASAIARRLPPALPAAGARSFPVALSSSLSSSPALLHLQQRRTFLSAMLGKNAPDEDEYVPSPRPAPSADKPEPRELLRQDDLFHPLSSSPFEDLRLRAERIKRMAPCPVCLEHFGERNLVAFDSPDAGWPTHCSEEHWKADDDHHKYIDRLREANEDEHDLRSGRPLVEFENLPGESSPLSNVPFRVVCEQGSLTSWRRSRASSPHAGYQPYDSIVNFTNWDTFFYTR
jgi:hypothetical protein